MVTVKPTLKRVTGVACRVFTSIEESIDWEADLLDCALIICLNLDLHSITLAKRKPYRICHKRLSQTE